MTEASKRRTEPCLLSDFRFPFSVFRVLNSDFRFPISVSRFPIISQAPEALSMTDALHHDITGYLIFENRLPQPGICS
jgi:hypothetical protein